MLALLGGACSSSSKTASSNSSSTSSSSSNGNKTAFCKFNADVNAKLANVTSADEALQVFKDLESGFDDYLKNAPSEVKADAQVQVDAARKAIKDNDASSIPNDSKVQAAGEHVDTFCGQKSSSSSSSSSSSTGSENAQGACGLFDLQAIGSATNLTWKIVDSSSSDACTIQADNGNTVAISVAPTSGQTAAALEGGKSRCDSGSEQQVDIADGGFVCQVSGVNTAFAVFAGSQKLVAAAAVTFNNASDSDVQQALVALLKSFQAS
jgi:hypothetical protein